ncbi:hypothetical protein [Winogradskyella eximia]|uniref:hypothetical protein n=1 Tax=Winogradskyella eximia TaxID=262006 RepID=UPI00249322BF|nr:hypothetical protein [Winogradskyella eximia]
MKKILIVFSLILISCHNDVEDIQITGVVQNKTTNKPINNIKLKVECWYYGNSPDESYTGKYDTIIKTNVNGEYKAIFKKGTFIYIEVDEPEFEKIGASKHLRWSNYTIDISLKSK